MIKTCQRCHKEFKNRRRDAKYCPDCLAAERRRIMQKLQARYDAQRSKRTGKTIEDWAREARACNLDYGNYRALIAAGKTFEELVAANKI